MLENGNGIVELKALGFTQLESEIYIYLLGAKPSSGYAISQAISKPAANVYKAINTLESKGAILVDDSKTRLCIPVPADELLNALEHTFKSQKERASKFLHQIERNEDDDKVYRLNKPEQVFEKCRKLLAQAQEYIVIDAFKTVLAPLTSEIETAAARGVKTAIHTYEPVEIKNARTFHNSEGQSIRDKWSGQWLNLVVDGRNFVMAYLSSDLSLVHQAVWSRSRYISWVYHSGLIAEQQLSEIKRQLKQINDIDVIRDLAANMESYFTPPARGYFELLEKYQNN